MKAVSHLSTFLRRLGPAGFFALLLGAGALSGCATAPIDGRAALPPGNAEIVVTNLTASPWRLALRSPKASDAIRVEIKPRETFTMTLPGDVYVVEQTIVPLVPTETTTRQFTAKFEIGERYRWSLATLLATDDVVAP